MPLPFGVLLYRSVLTIVKLNVRPLPCSDTWHASGRCHDLILSYRQSSNRLTPKKPDSHRQTKVTRRASCGSIRGKVSADTRFWHCLESLSRVGSILHSPSEWHVEAKRL